jgi:hypothetical protein
MGSSDCALVCKPRQQGASLPALVAATLTLVLPSRLPCWRSSAGTSSSPARLSNHFALGRRPVANTLVDRPMPATRSEPRYSKLRAIPALPPLRHRVLGGADDDRRNSIGLKDISLSFFPGAKIGVVGMNGAGKSTLLKIMAFASATTACILVAVGVRSARGHRRRISPLLVPLCKLAVDKGMIENARSNSAFVTWPVSWVDWSARCWPDRWVTHPRWLGEGPLFTGPALRARAVLPAGRGFRRTSGSARGRAERRPYPAGAICGPAAAG